MRSSYAIDKAISEILITAQESPPTLEFSISPEMRIENYQPPDFGIDSVSTDDGVYIYFDESDFRKSSKGGSSIGHYPQIIIDVYVSKEALKKTNGDMIPSPKRADLELREFTSQIFEAMQHTTFLRLVKEKLAANTTIDDDVDCSQVHIAKAAKLGVLKLPSNSKCTAVFRYKFSVGTSEIVGTNPGIAFTGTNDKINAYRKEGDLPE